MATSRDPLASANDKQGGHVAVRDPFDVAPRHPDSPPTLETVGTSEVPMLGAFEEMVESDAPVPWERRAAGGASTAQMRQLESSLNSPEDPQIAAWYDQGEALLSNAWEEDEPELRPQAWVRINLLTHKPRLRARVWQMVRVRMADVGFGPMDPTLTPEEEYAEMEAKKTAVAILACALVLVIVGIGSVFYVHHVYTARREAATSLVLEALTGSQEENGADVTDVLSSMDDRLAERVVQQEEEIADLEAQVGDLKTTQEQEVPAVTPVPVERSPEPPTPEVIVRVRRSAPAPGFVPIRIPRN